MQYLSVKNFEQYQHYKKRNPPWVKLYYALLDDFGFLALSERAQLLYVKLLLIASRTANQIPAEFSYLQKVCRSKLTKESVKELLDASFLLASDPITSVSDNSVSEDSVSERALCLHDASNMLAECLQPASKKRGNSHASAFPDAWAIEPWMESLCAGWRLNPQATFSEFKNYHLAKGSVMKSWPHAFRTWVSRAVKFAQKGSRP